MPHVVPVVTVVIVKVQFRRLSVDRRRRKKQSQVGLAPTIGTENELSAPRVNTGKYFFWNSTSGHRTSARGQVLNHQTLLPLGQVQTAIFLYQLVGRLLAGDKERAGAHRHVGELCKKMREKNLIFLFSQLLPFFIIFPSLVSLVFCALRTAPPGPAPACLPAPAPEGPDLKVSRGKRSPALAGRTLMPSLNSPDDGYREAAS